MMVMMMVFKERERGEGFLGDRMQSYNPFGTTEPEIRFTPKLLYIPFPPTENPSRLVLSSPIHGRRPALPHPLGTPPTFN